MRLKQFIERDSLDPFAIYRMDFDAIPSGFCDDFASRFRFAFIAEIIIDQRIPIHDYRQGFLERIQILLGRFMMNWNLFLMIGIFFRIDGFDKMGIMFSLIEDGQEHLLYLLFRILLADLITGRRE